MLLLCVYWHQSNCHCSVSTICLLPILLKSNFWNQNIRHVMTVSCSCFVFTYVLFTNLLQKTGLHLIPVTLVLSVLAFKPPASLRFCELQWKPKRFIVSTPHIHSKLWLTFAFPNGRNCIWSWSAPKYSQLGKNCEVMKLKHKDIAKCDDDKISVILTTDCWGTSSRSRGWWSLARPRRSGNIKWQAWVICV